MQKKLEEHDLTDSQLEESYWLITHWKKIEREVTIGLIVFSSLLFLFVLTRVLMIYVVDADAFDRFRANIQGALSSEARISLATAELGEITVTSLGSGRYDAASDVYNRMEDWRATARVVFIVNDVEQAPQSVIVYPGETAPALLLGFSSSDAPKVSARLGDIDWHRMTPDDLTVLAERRKIVVKDFVFFTSSETGISSSNFSVVNESIYSLWEVSFAVALQAGGRTVALNTATVTNLRAGEVRPVQIRWFTSLPPIDGYRITPQVDVFDARIVQPIESGQQRL